jgi:DNA-directed RNA polymerase subunit alpha
VQEDRLLDFHSPKITFEQVNENHGLFVVEPLDRGFGYTFGNSLRRVLLSSLEGAAVSGVKIDGVAHEFSTIRGVTEDVTDLILNLKRVVFVLHGEDDEIDVDLVKDGPGDVTAGDIEAPANLEIVNPLAHIATLEEGARLEVRLTVSRGRGYVSADDNKRSETVIGVIPIDSIYSPVTRVSYKVDSARVGQRTDFDKLTLEIETNGAVDPHSAVAKAAQLLRESLLVFADEERLAGDQDQGEEDVTDFLRSTRSDYDDMLIEELELGVRSYNCLKREGVETVGDLVTKSEAELLNIPNFGKKSIEEVRERLAERGLKLRGE